MRKILWSLLGVICMVVSGCSAVSVEHESLGSVDFSALKNYCWIDGDGAAADIRARNPKVEKLVMASLNRHLDKKGYNRTTRENADFYLVWFGKVDDKVAHNSISHFYRTSGYGVLGKQHPEIVGESAEEKTYTEGTLILDVIDAGSKNVIWRGAATDTIKDGMSEADIAAYIQRSVNKIMKEFPAR